MKNLLFYISAIFLINPVFAQQEDKVNQLVAAENFFAAQVKQKGIQKAFLAVSDPNTIIFRPGPVQAEKFLKNEADTSRGLLWEPVFAKISRSGDWGFTTGPYTYKGADPSKTGYGDYLSVWKKNPKGVWKLAIDLGVAHAKPTTSPKLTFLNAVTDKFMHQYSDTRLKQREEIVLSSDRLFATTLNADNKIAMQEFLADDCRLLFPGHEPILGNTAIMAFWEKEKMKLKSQPVQADRAFSGELAFTYGDASIEQNGKIKQYHYVRIWSVQAGYVWKVIAEVYTPGKQQ